MSGELQNLKTEDTVSDAAYRVKEKSYEPMGEGAFKGALASGIISRFLRPKGGLHPNIDRGLIVGGAAIGGALGEANHRRKIIAKKKAKEILYKQSDDVTTQTSPLMGGLAGAGLGAGLSAMTKGKSGTRGKWALAGGLSGFLGGYAGDLATNAFSKKVDEEEKRGNKLGALKAPLVFGVSGAVDGMLSPSVNKAIGYKMRNNPKMVDDIKAAAKESGKTGIFGKVMGTDLEDRHLLEGVNHTKGASFFHKKLLGSSLKNAGRQGLIGAALGYGINKLTSEK